jgi:methylisocitrate lyase
MSGEQLSELIESDEIAVAPGVFDGLTAKVVEDIGFDALYLGGFVVGSSITASEPMTTMTEMVERARHITNNTDLPLIVDGNAGFGNPSHTYRTIKEFSNAGIAAIHIEDQVYPKRMNYFQTEDRQGQKHVTDVEEMQHKIRAAVEAKEDSDSDIQIIARSDAARDQRREFETMEDAVDRVNAYFDAGADAGLLFPATNEEAEYVAEHTDGSMLYVMLENRQPVESRLSASELEEMGYEFAAYPISATVAATDAVKETYENLYETGDTEMDKDGFQETRNYINRIIGLHKFYEMEDRTSGK